MPRNKPNIYWLIFLLVASVNVALPSDPDDTPPQASVESPQDGPEEVSWQSLFWGLFALALNAMTQPSIIDVGFEQSSLLFPARSSPFICLGDTIHILFEMFGHIVNGLTIRESAYEVNWRRLRYRLGMDETKMLATTVETHPFASFVLFLLTVTQAIKIFALEGVYFPKIAAGIYLSSYIMIAVISLASKQPREEISYRELIGDRDRREKEMLITPTRLLMFISGLGHFIGCCYATYCVLHGSAASTGPKFLLAILSFTLWVVPMFAGIVYWAMLSFLLFALAPRSLAEIAQNVRDFDSVKLVLRILITIIAASVAYGVWAWIIHFLVILDTFSVAVDWILQGGGVLLLTWGMFWGLIVSVLHLLGTQKLEKRSRPMAVVSALINLGVSILYFRFGYDPKGTVKPPWTESLG